MAIEVIMPKNGMAMEEGKLIRWLKNVGDPVEKDEPLIEIETDKITMEEPAAASGVLLAKWAEDGQTVPVLKTIGWIGKEGEAVPEKSDIAVDVEPIPDAESTTDADATSVVIAADIGIPATPYAKKLASERGIPLSEIPATGKRGEIIAADVQAVKATPLANRMAEGMGVNLSDIAGTGFGGKITKDDVLAADLSAVRTGGSISVPMTGMRKSIAKNMTVAHSIPCVTQLLRADVTDLLALRAQLNESREDKFSLNDFIVKAVAKALTKHPGMLVSFDGENVIRHDRVNLGVAVALEEGLIVPVVMDADKLSLTSLSKAISELAGRARKSELLPQEYQGSTFTVSNMGMYGVEGFTPIINPPNAAILGICAVMDELALDDGEITVKKKMGLCMTYDHRLIDGVPATKFMLTLQGILQTPMEILL